MSENPRKGRKGHVVVVDDERSVLRIFERLLERAGFDVSAADNADDALELVKRGADALVSDIAMPGTSGVELVRRARGAARWLPVVLTTGSPSVTTAVEAMELEVFRYMVKPFEGGALVDAVERAVLVGRMQRLRSAAAGVDDAFSDAKLSSALASLWMAYQPIVHADGTLFGYEALLRCDEPALPEPPAVLRAAERLGRVHDVGRAVRDCAAASFDVAAPAVLLVNLHARDLLDDDLLEPVSALHRMARRVVLEITERAALSEIGDLRGRITALRKLGFRIALDDIGSGYAALASFPLLEPDIVKLDMCLVRDIDTLPMKRRLVSSIVALCREMSIDVIGEGIETGAERDALRDLGCPLFQGYLIGRPARRPSPPEGQAEADAMVI